MSILEESYCYSQKSCTFAAPYLAMDYRVMELCPALWLTNWGGLHCR
jgi:hypothetical protein